MKTVFFAKPLLSGAFWGALFLALFSAPVMLAARVSDDDRTAELIRQHQEALSPWPPAAAAPALPGACERADEGPMEQETSMEDGATPETPIIRAVGKRGHRIQV